LDRTKCYSSPIDGRLIARGNVNALFDSLARKTGTCSQSRGNNCGFD
jgi:hypothetical protein